MNDPAPLPHAIPPPGAPCTRCGRPAVLIAGGKAYCGAVDCYECYVAAATAVPSSCACAAPRKPQRPAVTIRAGLPRTGLLHGE